ADRSRAAARSGAALPRVVRSTLVLPGPGQNVDRVVGPAGCGPARSVGYRWRPGRPSAPRRIRGTGRVQREYDMAGTGRKLVIVESPAKARKIGEYLGPGYTVDASVGHIRDLPNPSELPPDMKKGPYGKFAINIEADFDPYYVVDADKKKKVNELKRALKESDELLLATDEDREGEAIAWHLREVLQPKVPVRRMVFLELPPEA